MCRMELIELCGVMAAPSADFLQDLPVLRRFLGAYTRLEVEEIRMRLYNEHGVLKPPPGVVNVLIIILLSAAATLRCVASFCASDCSARRKASANSSSLTRT